MAATLPDVQAQSQPPVPQPAGGIASFEPTNWRQIGIAGEALSRAGHDIEEATSLLAATNERQDQINAQAAANALAQHRINLEFDPKDGFRNMQEGQTVGQQFVTAYGTRFIDATSSIRDGLANDNQRRIFDQHAQVQGLQFKSALLEHQARETQKFNDTTDDASVNIALRGMAQKPTDELAFQTGLAQINGTLDSMAKRKGLPAAVLDNLKATYLDAAYSTRITSIMDGIPGVAPANPYLAERMFKQVQGQLGVKSQVDLAAKVQKAVQSVQARDTAQAFIFGTQTPTAPATIAPAATGAPLAGAEKPDLTGIVEGLESGGRDTDAAGNPLTSRRGAVGRMQVMPATAADPGFGVRPAQAGPDGKVPLAEMARVARDYLGAMTARYDNPALVLAAYNAGPGQVDKWIAQYGDPRTGAISTADWAGKIPFAETRNYVTAGLGKIGAQPATSGTAAQPAQQQAQTPPTANQLKEDLYQRVQAARALAEQQYPGDTAYADSVAARVESYGRMVIANQQGIQAGARDTLVSGLTGTKPDGSDRPLTIDQLLANPAMKRAWDAATPDTHLYIQTHFKNGAGDPPRTAESQALRYRYMGMAANDREAFANEDLSHLITKLPHSDFDYLSGLQLAARNKAELADAKEREKAVNLQRALQLATNFALKPAGIVVPGKDTPQGKREIYDQYTGRLTDALENFRTAHNRVPTDKEIIDIAKGLTTQVTVPGTGWFSFDKTKKVFELTPEEEERAVPPMTAEEKAATVKALTERYGFAPDDSMVRQARLLDLLHPEDMARLGAFDRTMRLRAAKVPR